MLNELTDVQINAIPDFVEKWLSVGLSSQPASRAHAEAGARRCYQTAGLPDPDLFLWVQSPLEGAVANFAVQRLGDLKAKDGRLIGKNVASKLFRLRDEALEVVRGNVADSVFAHITGRLGDPIDSRVYDRVEMNVAESIEVGLTTRSSAWRNVEQAVSVAVPVTELAYLQAIIRDEPSLGGQVRREGLLGQGMAAWLGLFDYFSSVCDVDCARPVEGWSQIGQSCGWWWPLEGACIMTERHCELYLDQDQELHNDSKAAVEYPDGWGIFCWHGTLVPEWVITRPQVITTASILSERDPNIRSAMLGQFGESQFVEETAIEVLTSAQYRSWVAELAADQKQRIALIRSPSGRQPAHYLIRHS